MLKIDSATCTGKYTKYDTFPRPPALSAMIISRNRTTMTVSKSQGQTISSKCDLPSSGLLRSVQW
jgi:hypothetical protein